MSQNDVKLSHDLLPGVAVEIDVERAAARLPVLRLFRAAMSVAEHLKKIEADLRRLWGSKL